MGDRRGFGTLLAALATLFLFIAAFPARRHAVTSAQPSAPAPAPAGENAETPAEIPPRGWWQVLKRVGANFSSHRILAEAAGITFYALLGLFPALAALVSLYGLFADPASIEQQIAALNGVVPGGGMQIVSGQLHSLAAQGHQALGLGLIVGLVVSLWSANQGIKALFDSLNVVYNETEKRSFLKLTA
ncbi:MAG: YihY/virulence factor BrkB family protein, partial [Acetobacteraceae bacterium]